MGQWYLLQFAVAAAPVQVLHQLFTILHAIEFVHQAVFNKSILRQLPILRIVVCQQNFDWRNGYHNPNLSTQDGSDFNGNSAG